MIDRRSLSLLFGFRAGVSRRAYVAWGFLLFALKYSVDLALSAAFASRLLDPLTYFNPFLSQRLSALGEHPEWLPMVMLIWALPFIWVGVSMSARRAVNAGYYPGLGLLFLLPVLNYLAIVFLCIAPERSEAELARLDAARVTRWTDEGSARSKLARLRTAMASVLAATAFGFVAMLFGVYGTQQYGSALFIGAPFLLGVISGVLFNRPARQSGGATIASAVLSVTLTGGVLLVTALEGALCLAMAAVLAYPLAIMGALLGRAIAFGSKPLQPTLSMLAAWPLLALLQWDVPERFPVRATRTSVEIDARPEDVWPHVIAFPPLPPPSEWLMQTGVACPLSARIVGEGVGAIRYCEFTTGPFVEPITAWEPPHRLAFDVSEQPPSMHEWSPYDVVHAPHLHGGLQSLRGEFELTRLPKGRTRLEGTTWYRLKMAPNAYWSWYGDYAIHAIHRRVLSHIRELSSTPAAASP